MSAWYGALFWPLVRVLGLFASAPLLSHRAVPIRLKIGLGVMITALIVPNVSAPPVGDVLTGAGLQMLAGNILVGVVMGFTVRLVFAAFEIAGEMLGLQMGLSYAGFFSPSTGTMQNSAASFLSLIALLLFVTIDGHLMLIHALAESFRVFPITGESIAAGLSLQRVVGLGAEMFSIAISIALPFLGVMLLTNIVLGVLARVAPQLNIFAVGFPLTILVGLSMLYLLLPYLEAPARVALERAALLWNR
ncbi:MAG TPA: flagellar biosynthetic protein FliR [Burkholderiaceae bacterium]|nr:flagellar biosynthetic protein FliR [Burkholderiaceae bacterium]